MCSDKRRVLSTKSRGGLPRSEITLAEALKQKNYATACIGKWHLGHLPQHLPMRHGFDSYFGIPYSNDMKPTCLMEGEAVLENPAVQATLTRRYTERALAFMEGNRHRPFFLYFPHTFPHTPLHASKAFKGTSRRGLYGDVVKELDWSVGRILEAARRLGLTKHTLVFFTSDNGPWLIRRQRGGSASLLRGGKGSTWEGGVREPCLAWWPGRIRPGSVSAGLASTLDVFPTCLALAGIPLPKDRIMDGYDLAPLLLGTSPSPRKEMFYYRGTRLMACRKGPWKAHFLTRAGYRQKKAKKHDPPLLYHLDHDPSERFNSAKTHPKVIADILEIVARHRKTVKPVKSQLER